MQHRDIITLKKILKELEIAKQILGNATEDTFISNEMLKRSICMTVINIGELVKNLSDELREENKNIPWKRIAGFRDIAAHKYATLSMSDVYSTVINDFPELSHNIENILS